MRGESVRPGKRPIRALSASEKMDAIQRVHEGESKASVARDIGVPESTLRGWCKSEHKIRGMARNSSTPDSEAHSPASSSGTNVATSAATNATNLSSEDEGPASKRSKLNNHVPAGSSSSYGSNENAENEVKMDDKSKIDYVGLMSSMAGMRADNSSLLLQQLGLLSGATGTLAKNLLNSVPVSLAHGSAVGLVENGLQYTKSNGNGNNNNNNKRQSISAVAPNQMDSVVAKSCSRKSLPPAGAEAPSTPVPASPRKMNENTQQSGRGKKDNGSGNKKVDEALWLWLTQQQQLLGQQSVPFNLSVNQQDGSWFWQWYKQCSFPLAAAAATALTTGAATTTTTTNAHAALPIAKKSPTKIRALLDNALCNNNNENVKHGQMQADANGTDSDVPGSMEEAIEHGEKFFKWLDNCSDPAVTRLQTMQFKFLLDNLKACRNKSNRKHSRK